MAVSISKTINGCKLKMKKMTGDKTGSRDGKKWGPTFSAKLKRCHKGAIWLRKLTTTYKFHFFFLHWPFVKYNKIVGGDKVNTEFYGKIHVIG